MQKKISKAVAQDELANKLMMIQSSYAMVDSDSESFECEGVQWKMNGSDKLTDLRKATLPVDLLEDLSYEK